MLENEDQAKRLMESTRSIQLGKNLETQQKDSSKRLSKACKWDHALIRVASGELKSMVLSNACLHPTCQKQRTAEEAGLRHSSGELTPCTCRGQC